MNRFVKCAASAVVAILGIGLRQNRKKMSGHVLAFCVRRSENLIRKTELGAEFFRPVRVGLLDEQSYKAPVRGCRFSSHSNTSFRHTPPF
jgi:hypothetical protein